MRSLNCSHQYYSDFGKLETKVAVEAKGCVTNSMLPSAVLV